MFSFFNLYIQGRYQCFERTNLFISWCQAKNGYESKVTAILVWDLGVWRGPNQPASFIRCDFVQRKASIKFVMFIVYTPFENKQKQAWFQSAKDIITVNVFIVSKRNLLFQGSVETICMLNLGGLCRTAIEMWSWFDSVIGVSALAISPFDSPKKILCSFKGFLVLHC